MQPFHVTSIISTTGSLCLLLFQMVLSDLPCEENEMCINYNDQHPNGRYVWLVLLIFSVALLCGGVFFCFQCWLKRWRIHTPRRTMAVFAVGDLDPIYAALESGSPATRIHLPSQNPEQYPAPCFGALGPPPPYEEILRTSQF
ncbi:transmembrane protein 207 [Nannospalax galili]|uniref:transmembrane protein 207 n=1 Tax=Nannospalax galili TaxID=1026970 RepID=UPI0004ED1D87|nr:transmembrane protein 207 [Nannospalax galili]